jgi:hypothetical protein
MTEENEEGLHKGRGVGVSAYRRVAEREPRLRSLLPFDFCLCSFAGLLFT